MGMRTRRRRHRTPRVYIHNIILSTWLHASYLQYPRVWGYSVAGDSLNRDASHTTNILDISLFFYYY